MVLVLFTVHFVNHEALERRSANGPVDISQYLGSRNDSGNVMHFISMFCIYYYHLYCDIVEAMNYNLRCSL